MNSERSQLILLIKLTNGDFADTLKKSTLHIRMLFSEWIYFGGFKVFREMRVRQDMKKAPLIFSEVLFYHVR